MIAHTQPTTSRRELYALFAVLIAVVVGVLAVRFGITSFQQANSSAFLSQTGAQAGSFGTQPVASITNHAPDADWQPMTVTYEVDGMTMRLAYASRHAWSAEILESPADASLVGTIITFENSIYTRTMPGTVDAETGEPAMFEDVMTDGVAVPERWLRPEFAHILDSKRYVMSAGDEPDRVVFTQHFTVPCSTGPGPVAQPDVCNSGDTFDQTEVFVFRTDMTPPLVVSFEMSVEGEVTQTGIVLEVTLQ